MADTSDKLAEDVSALNLNSSNAEQGSDKYEAKWGFRLPELYKIALKFYKEKNGTALKLTYKDKLRLVAYTKQASHGKYRNDVSPEVGFLDVVGSDRRQAWQALGDMSKESAMEEFVKDLDRLCVSFKPYIDAHRTEKLEQLQKQKEEEERLKREAEEQERRRLEEEAQKQLEMQRKRELEQEMQIRAALNQQTAVQFAQYAQQQYPGNKQQQEELIRQLQEQHYQQYMQQVYQQQYLHQQQQYQQIQAANMASHTQNPPTQNGPQNGLTEQQTQGNEQQHLQTQQQQQPSLPPQNQQTPQRPDDPQINGQVAPLDNPTNPSNGELEDELPPLAAAPMWTHKDLKEFKDSLCKDKDSVIKIGSGETVTVRVPTHEDGTCLFWEFATDYYDIGFGVYFEWTIAPNSTVSVHISESSDEEEFEEDLDGKGSGDSKGDVEKGSKKDDRPPTDEIIPVYRRDCHEEVYCGSHAYPGQGVYLLKFDNSYSLLRSKTLYYRVYYSR